MNRAVILFAALAVSVAVSCGGSSKPKAAASAPGLQQSPAAAQDVAATLAQGLADHQAGKISDAQKEYEAVLAADPTNKFALYNMGLINQTSNKPKDAESFYRRALLIDPNFGSALFNLAILRTAAPDGKDEAIDLYRHLIAVDPNNPDAHGNLGVLLKAVGRNSEADIETQTAAKLRQQPPPAAPGAPPPAATPIPGTLPTPPATIARP